LLAPAIVAIAWFALASLAGRLVTAAPAPLAAPPPVAAPASGNTTTATVPSAATGAIGGAAAAAPAPTPTSARAALERTRAAYEYGDIDEMVEWSRQVTEGKLEPTPTERANALRFLGIGLFLTGRAPGAETAFFELLRIRPESRLDPTTTRPDVVAFFEQVRHRHTQEIEAAARANNPKFFLWNFLPPIGQFQNGNRALGFTIGALELVSVGTAATTYALLRHWEGHDLTFKGHEQDARAMKIVNWVAVGILAATYAFGVVDGIAHYGERADDAGVTGANGSPTAYNRRARAAHLSVAPNGFTLTF